MFWFRSFKTDSKSKFKRISDALSIPISNEPTTASIYESTDAGDGPMQVGSFLASPMETSSNDSSITATLDVPCVTNRPRVVKPVGNIKRQYTKRTVRSGANDKSIQLQHKLQNKCIMVKRLKMQIKRKTASILELQNELEKFKKIAEVVLNNVAKLQNKEEEGDTYSTIMMDQVSPSNTNNGRIIKLLN